jgi:mono/diheme cytochrome c family protein
MGAEKIRTNGLEIPNTKFRTGSWILLCLVMSSGVLAGAVGKFQAPSNSDTQFQTLIRSVDGPDLFRAYCASCHGKDGRGNGPAAPAMKIKVPDLTVIAKNNGGRFPAARVRRIILGDDVISAHGSREMPVWGPIFHQIESDVDRGYVRVENLVKYVESIQQLQKK